MEDWRLFPAKTPSRLGIDSCLHKVIPIDLPVTYSDTTEVALGTLGCLPEDAPPHSCCASNANSFPSFNAHWVRSNVKSPRYFTAFFIIISIAIIITSAIAMAVYFTKVKYSIEVRVRITNIEFSNDMEDKRTASFKKISNLVCSEIIKLYTNSSIKRDYAGCEVMSIRKGSILVILFIRFTRPGLQNTAAEIVFWAVTQKQWEFSKLKVDIGNFEIYVNNILWMPPRRSKSRITTTEDIVSQTETKTKPTTKEQSGSTSKTTVVSTQKENTAPAMAEYSTSIHSTNVRFNSMSINTESALETTDLNRKTDPVTWTVRTTGGADTTTVPKESFSLSNVLNTGDGNNHITTVSGKHSKTPAIHRTNTVTGTTVPPKHRSTAGIVTLSNTDTLTSNDPTKMLDYSISTADSHETKVTKDLSTPSTEIQQRTSKHGGDGLTQTVTTMNGESDSSFSSEWSQQNTSLNVIISSTQGLIMTSTSNDSVTHQAERVSVTSDMTTDILDRRSPESSANSGVPIDYVTSTPTMVNDSATAATDFVGRDTSNYNTSDSVTEVISHSTGNVVVTKTNPLIETISRSTGNVVASRTIESVTGTTGSRSAGNTVDTSPDPVTEMMPHSTGNTVDTTTIDSVAETSSYSTGNVTDTTADSVTETMRYSTGNAVDTTTESVTETSSHSTRKVVDTTTYSQIETMSHSTGLVNEVDTTITESVTETMQHSKRKAADTTTDAMTETISQSMENVAATTISMVSTTVPYASLLFEFESNTTEGWLGYNQPFLPWKTTTGVGDHNRSDSNTTFALRVSSTRVGQATITRSPVTMDAICLTGKTGSELTARAGTVVRITTDAQLEPTDSSQIRVDMVTTNHTYSAVVNQRKKLGDVTVLRDGWYEYNFGEHKVTEMQNTDTYVRFQFTGLTYSHFLIDEIIIKCG